MGDQRDGGIAWTQETWNPIRGCSRVSLGCGGPHGQGGCYAERLAIRFSGPGQAYEGLVKSTPAGPRWTGKVALVESALDLPLRWKKPRRIFVNSMSDLFHEKVADEWIIGILRVIERAPQHTFQVLTKRPERMLDFFIGTSGAGASAPVLPNLWLGVSVEDQATADERIPLLLQTPAAVRWVSYEPALAGIDRWKTVFPSGDTINWLTGMVRPNAPLSHDPPYPGPHLDWIVVGGESGPGARPFDLAWARQTIAQGRAAGIPVFVKQVGSRAVWSIEEYKYRHGERIAAADIIGDRARFYTVDRKGGAMEEWPADLRVREYPGGQ